MKATSQNIQKKLPHVTKKKPRKQVLPQARAPKKATASATKSAPAKITQEIPQAVKGQEEEVNCEAVPYLVLKGRMKLEHLPWKTDHSPKTYMSYMADGKYFVGGWSLFVLSSQTCLPYLIVCVCVCVCVFCDC